MGTLPAHTCPAGQQTSLQQLWSVGQKTVPQGFMHWPPTQLAPTGQTFPQAPQLAALLCRSTQLPAQAFCPVGQTHWPLTQIVPVGVPVGQAWPHAPQFASSLCRSTQAVPQAVSAAGQERTQLPCEQR